MKWNTVTGPKAAPSIAVGTVSVPAVKAASATVIVLLALAAERLSTTDTLKVWLVNSSK